MKTIYLFGCISVASIASSAAIAQECFPKPGEVCWRDSNGCHCMPDPATLIQRTESGFDIKFNSLTKDSLSEVADTLSNTSKKLIIEWNGDVMTGEIKGLSEDKAKEIFSKFSGPSRSVPKQ